MATTLPGTYTAAQVSEILQIPVTEVYRAASAGEIPGRIRIGNRTRFSQRIIDALANGADPSQAS